MLLLIHWSYLVHICIHNFDRIENLSVEIRFVKFLPGNTFVTRLTNYNQPETVSLIYGKCIIIIYEDKSAQLEILKFVYSMCLVVCVCVFCELIL